jgi:TrmH family RNA methyltransferase
LKELITSTKNEYIKTLKSLKSKKGRLSEGLFLVEGFKCTQELFQYSAELVSSLLVSKDLYNDNIVNTAEMMSIPVYPVMEHVLESVSDQKTSQGIIAVVKTLSYEPIMSGFILAMDDVSDPQNVGTIIRTADAAGCAGVLLSPQSADFMSPKAVRASMGSIFHIPVFVEDLTERLSFLKDNGYRIACADMHGSAVYDYNWQNTCLVIGNEARGISKEVLSLGTDKISITMYGMAESLNASVAAGILIYKIKE